VSRLAGLLVALLRAGGALRPPAARAPADRAAIVGVAEAWMAAAARRDADAIAGLYTADALLLPPNRPAVSGRDGIRAWFLALPAFSRMATDTVEIDGRADLAVARATFAMTLPLPGQPAIEERGKILQVLRRQPDGRWLIWRESFSSDTPRPPPPR
jgi:uncharacterized protein (TIGR02246 family)